MKLTQVFLLITTVLLHWARAQDGSQDNAQRMPTCALGCMQTYIPQSICAANDQKCVCSNELLQQILTSCVISNCSVKESLTTQSIAAQTCGWPLHNKQPTLQGVTIAFLVLATLFYAARITSRLRVFGGEFGADDYMISIAYLLAAGFSVILILSASAGLGKDIWHVPFDKSNDEVTYTLKLFVAIEKTYILTIWCTKISILLLYLRIFPDSKFRAQVRLAIAFCGVTAFCLFFACLFKCWPVSYSWTFWDGEHHGSCSSQNAQGWANAGLNIFGDLLVLGLPLPTIWRMSLSRSKRLGIMFMFGVGIFITLVSMIRLYTLKIFSFSKNPTWDFVNISLWSILEVDVGIMCACLPGARNFYSRVICGKILGTGPFAQNNKAVRTGSPCSFQSHMVERAQHQNQWYGYGWSDSAMSNESDASTVVDGDAEMNAKDVIYVVRAVRVDVEEGRVVELGEEGNREWLREDRVV